MDVATFEERRGEFTISTDQSRLDIEAIWRFLSEESYWARGLPAETLERAIKNSLCFGVYRGTVQVGFARVVTDFATFAYLCDVFVLETSRGKGLGKWLTEFIRKHPALQGLRRWLLATADAHDLYKKSGWSSPGRPECFMEIVTPYAR